MMKTPNSTHLLGEPVPVQESDEGVKKRKSKNQHPNTSRPIGEIEYIKLKKECTNQKLLRAMALLYYFGFRVNETKQFTKKAIEEFITRGDTQAYISKQNIKRTLFLEGENMKEEFSVLLKECMGEYFVKYSGDSLRVCLNRHIEEVLGEGYSSHGFRKGFITNIIRLKGDPRLAQETIGHSSLSTTLNYDTLEEKDIRGAYALR